MEAELAAMLEPWARLGESAAEFEQVWKEVEEKQAQSLAAKKRLSDDTKNFKRLPDPERLGSMSELLKAYQGEIDSLSKRAKFAEAALGELLKALREAPKTEALQGQLQTLVSAKGKASGELEEQLRQRDLQVAKLTEATRDLEAELQTVTNQAATVRRLQMQIKEMEAGAEAGTAEARRQKDEEWGKKLEDLRQELGAQRQQQREAIEQLAKQRELREDEIERLRQQQWEEQRLAEEAVMARASEVDTLSSDLEKVQAELERERLQRAEHKETQGSVKVLQSLLDGVQQRAAGLEREAAELRRQLAEAEQRAQHRELDHQAQLQQLAAATAGKDAEVQGLREQLSLRPSFDEVAELRQQLRNVETVELADMGAAATDLERRLLQRQRVLEGQLSEARVRAQEFNTEGEALRAKLQAAEDEAKDLQRLVRRLEAELAGGAAAGAGKVATTAAAAEPTPFAALLPTAGADAAAAAGAGALGLGGAEAAAAGQAMPSMLEIVTGQRDRLRERAGDLEQERDRWRVTAEQEKKRAETLHADNVKLLERARYLQSFQPKQGGGGRGRARGKAAGVDLALESRYSAAYEDGLGPANPFEQFREEEKARRVAGMNAGERGLVMVGTALLSSRVARLFTLVYASVMHFLVFAVLLRLAQMHHDC